MKNIGRAYDDESGFENDEVFFSTNSDSEEDMCTGVYQRVGFNEEDNSTYINIRGAVIFKRGNTWKVTEASGVSPKYFFAGLGKTIPPSTGWTDVKGGSTRFRMTQIDAFQDPKSYTAKLKRYMESLPEGAKDAKDLNDVLMKAMKAAEGQQQILDRIREAEGVNAGKRAGLGGDGNGGSSLDEPLIRNPSSTAAEGIDVGSIVAVEEVMRQQLSIWAKDSTENEGESAKAPRRDSVKKVSFLPEPEIESAKVKREKYLEGKKTGKMPYTRGNSLSPSRKDKKGESLSPPRKDRLHKAKGASGMGIQVQKTREKITSDKQKLTEQIQELSKRSIQKFGNEPEEGSSKTMAKVRVEGQIRDLENSSTVLEHNIKALGEIETRVKAAEERKEASVTRAIQDLAAARLMWEETNLENQLLRKEPAPPPPPPLPPKSEWKDSIMARWTQPPRDWRVGEEVTFIPGVPRSGAPGKIKTIIKQGSETLYNVQLRDGAMVLNISSNNIVPYNKKDPMIWHQS